ncbi:isotrichodermin C-15 hydroxylase [Aspergillus lentulus]|nr:isotrichodermin C-15 hydroxylase [Aspergillus lentulus]
MDGKCSALLITGGETTATALSATLYFLARNENVERKALGEIRSTFNSFGGISVNQLKYLSACINYALRNFSPGPRRLMRRWTLHATASIAAAALSIKTNLFENSGSGIPRQNHDRHAMRAFSYGPRNCIAHVLAWLEMRLVLARLIWEVNWELAPLSDWKVTLVFKVWSTKPLRINYTLKCYAEVA